MKKWSTTLIAVTVILAGCWTYLWWGPPHLRLVAKGDIAFSFAQDLREYVLAHSGELPNNWKDFEEWTSQRDGKTRWPAESTEKRMKLLSPPYEVRDGIPQCVQVIDKDLVGLEGRINGLVYSAQIELGTTNNPANKALHRTQSPERRSEP